MQFRRRTGPRVAIDIAPLVDVVFLLVIFFAVSTTFLETAGLKLELPESSSKSPRETREVAVYISAAGEISLGDEIVSPDALRERLREALARTDRKMVVLRADTNTPHGTVVRVMDAARESGAVGLTVAARAAAE